MLKALIICNILACIFLLIGILPWPEWFGFVEHSNWIIP